MAGPIEEYALIGDTQSAALVRRDGSIEWMCIPRFDSDACFAALLGTEANGRWQIRPQGGVRAVRRRYRPESLVLETTFETEDGEVRVLDCMPPRRREPNLVRVIQGVRGSVPMTMDLRIRFGYGAVLPWLRRTGAGFTAVAGPDALSLYTPVPVRSTDATLSAELTVRAGESAPFLLVWHPSIEPPPTPVDPLGAVDTTEAWWRAWSAQCNYQGAYRDDVMRSLITLKALTYLPTGGIVAAPTTSLPEHLGGVRNWDYRYCWLRDATFTLLALIESGFREEAQAWCDWLLRAVAGHPSQFQIMYGVQGERRLTEITLPWLPGYEGSSPVRIGNGAVEQFQLDVFGELMDCLHQARGAGIHVGEETWRLQRELLDFLESHWHDPDEGFWEVRGGPRHFTQSKVMAWVAFDRAVKAVERFGMEGPADRWSRARDQIHAEVCEKGYDPRRGTFTQYYGATALDADLLLIPLVGFLPPDDPRVVGTRDAIARELCDDGLILRYRSDPSIEGLPGREGAFLACSFWMTDNLALAGRSDDALHLFHRLLSLTNDVGLLSEEYDPHAKRLLGNFPQALSHVALINSARNLSLPPGPAERRRSG